MLREAVSSKSNRYSQILRVPQTAGPAKTSRPVTSAEAGGSGDAFPALQHFSRLSVDRANQQCPGPSIPVRRSPFLISKGPSRVCTIQFIIYLVQRAALLLFLKSLLARENSTHTKRCLPFVVGRSVAQYKPQTDPTPPCHPFLNTPSTYRTISAQVVCSRRTGLPLRMQLGASSIISSSVSCLYPDAAAAEALHAVPQHGPICTTHTGRLIQVTVCELDGILSFGPSQKPEASGPPTGPRWNKGLHTTRQPPRRLRLKSRGPALALASPAMASFPLPGPSPHI